MQPNRDVLNELSLWTAKMATMRSNGVEKGERRDFEITPGFELCCDFSRLKDESFPTFIRVDFGQVPFDEPDDYKPIERVDVEMSNLLKEIEKHMKMGWLPNEWIPDAGFFQ